MQCIPTQKFNLVFRSRSQEYLPLQSLLGVTNSSLTFMFDLVSLEFLLRNNVRSKCKIRQECRHISEENQLSIHLPFDPLGEY